MCRDQKGREKGVFASSQGPHGIANGPSLFVAIGDAKCIANGGALRREHCGCVLEEEVNDKVRPGFLHDVRNCGNGKEEYTARVEMPRTPACTL